MRLSNKAVQDFRNEQIVCLSKEGGFSQAKIAELVKCSQSWVSKKLKPPLIGEAEKEKKLVGSTPKLNADQLDRLQLVLSKGAQAAGFPTDNWTCARIAQVILDEFKVSYSYGHVSRILKKINYTRQKPKQVDYRQDKEQLANWKEKSLPALKKKLN